MAAIVWRKICDTGATACTIEARLNLAAAVLLASISVTIRSTKYRVFTMRQVCECGNHTWMKGYAACLAILSRDEVNMTALKVDLPPVEIRGLPIPVRLYRAGMSPEDVNELRSP